MDEKKTRLSRWRANTARKAAPPILAPEPLVWDITGHPPSPRNAVLILRPWEGEILLSLGTAGSAPQALLRRPWLLEEEDARGD